MAANPLRHISGMEIGKYSSTQFEIRPGSITTPTGDARYDFTTANYVNLASTGAWGMDTGSPANGDGIYLYLIDNGSTPAIIASKSIIIGGVTAPSGYTVKRKLPFGIIYNSNWGGIPDFHLSSWPHGSFIRLTGAEYSSKWMPISGAASVAWKDINLSHLMPDNARLAYVMVQKRYVSGKAGSGYLRTYSEQSTGLLVGSATVGSPQPGQLQIPIRVTSTRKIQYKTTGNVLMYLQFIGYSMTEPS